jgi:hypothetical protein
MGDMMVALRRRAAATAATLALASLAPGVATAALTVGISENQSSMFSDPLFQQLGAKHVRVLVPYDVMTAGRADLGRVTAYLQAAQAAGAEPLVTFEHPRGDASLCRGSALRRLAQCRLPSPAAYKANVRAFLAHFPQVRVISPWNEINHFTQPTARNPAAAARLTNIVHGLCKSCRILAADILDQADRAGARRPTFRATGRYIREFRRHLRVPRRICGLHNYSDTNRFRDVGTRAIIRALGCRQIWLTETGGIYRFASFKASERRQARAIRHMFKVARKYKQVKRVYVYNWFGNVTSRFDAGLVADGRPRPAYFEVRKRIGR